MRRSVYLLHLQKITLLVLQVEDYDVYAYYANNYKDVVPIFEKLLDDPEFVSYLEVFLPAH